MAASGGLRRVLALVVLACASLPCVGVRQGVVVQAPAPGRAVSACRPPHRRVLGFVLVAATASLRHLGTAADEVAAMQPEWRSRPEFDELLAKAPPVPELVGLSELPAEAPTVLAEDRSLLPSCSSVSSAAPSLSLSLC